MSYKFADSLLSANLYVLLCVQCKTPGNGQRNCPKHVQFYSKNKLEKLEHLVGFIIRIYHDARSPERQIQVVVDLSEPTLIKITACWLHKLGKDCH